MGKKKTKQLTAPTGQRHGKKPDFKDTRGSERVEMDYLRFYETLYRREISDWLSARIVRLDPFNPITFPIQQLYKDSMLDNHLRGAFNSRKLRVTNKEIVLKTPDGEVDVERSSPVQTRWMRSLIGSQMESLAYGYSMVFCENLGTPKQTIIPIPRENIIPERGIIVKNAFDPNSQAIKYTDYPNHFIYMQLGEDAVGFLERIAPMTIYKRHSWASWDDFEQIFGVPIRVARTMLQTDKHYDQLQSWLETMGKSSYAIFDKHTDIEVKENSHSDAFQVFYQKVQAINKEISKGIIGQTMTMEDGASQSQAEVHMQIFNDITDADLQNVKDWLTDEIIPVLRYWGFDIPEGYYFDLLEKTVLKPKDKIVIDDILLRHGYNIQPEYIEETYGVPLDKKEPRSLPAGQMLSHGKGIDDFFA